MLNRRFLRVKALQEIYAYHQSKGNDLAKAERHLLESVDNLYELFVYQLSFWVEVKRFAERRIEENRNKHLLALEDKYKINWADFREDFIRGFYNRLLNTVEYQQYMSNGEDCFEDDKRLLMAITDNYMAEDSMLYDFYADRKLSFNSDYQVSLFLFWKFINELPASFNEDSSLPRVFKTENGSDMDDKTFVIKLFEKTILHADEYREMVKENLSNWDYDRLVLMDKILIFMALTEFCEFRFIPVKVTINEYIEISKFYSSLESRRFVNGLLDKLATQLKEEGKLVKTGLGLVEK